MGFDWDERKRAANLAKHGLDFADVVFLAWETAQLLIDDRRDYGETRYQAFGLWTGRLCVVAFTIRGEKFRLISFRKANAREVRRYAEKD
jgi:uncharacterized DUF497 family protein